MKTRKMLAMLMLVIMLSFGITILSGAAELKQDSELKTASAIGYTDGYYDDEYYDSAPAGGHGLIWIPISLVFGAIVASAMNGSEKASMKTVREQTRANYYFKQGGLNLNVNQNIFLYKRTERTPLNQDQNMGGMGPGQMNPQTGVRTGMPNQTVSRMPQSGASGNPYQPMTPTQTRSPQQPGPSQTRSPYVTNTQTRSPQHSSVTTQSPRSPYQPSGTSSRPSSSIQSNPSSGSRSSSSMNHSPSGASGRSVTSTPSRTTSSSPSRPSSSTSSRPTSSSSSRSSTPTRTATPPRPSSSSTANRRPSGGPKR